MMSDESDVRYSECSSCRLLTDLKPQAYLSSLTSQKSIETHSYALHLVVRDVCIQTANLLVAASATATGCDGGRAAATATAATAAVAADDPYVNVGHQRADLLCIAVTR